MDLLRVNFDITTLPFGNKYFFRIKITLPSNIAKEGYSSLTKEARKSAQYK
jgi:hypothetical protein